MMPQEDPNHFLFMSEQKQLQSATSSRWCGKLHSDQVLYRVLVEASTESGSVLVSITDGRNAWEGHMQDGIASQNVAPVPMREKRVLDVFHSDEHSEYVQLVKKDTCLADETSHTESSMRVTVSVPWGTEMGVRDIVLQIADIQLQNVPLARFYERLFVRLNNSKKRTSCLQSSIKKCKGQKGAKTSLVTSSESQDADAVAPHTVDT